VTKRMFDCCLMFMIYSHNTGFDPRNAILSMLSDFSVPVHYADIYKQLPERHKGLCKGVWSTMLMHIALKQREGTIDN